MVNLYKSVFEYNFKKIQGTPCLFDNRSNKGTKKKIGYKNVLCSFDIETTRLPEIEQAFMYIWQFAIYFLEDDEIDVIIGRTWDEFNMLLENLSNDDNEAKYLIFVHNLSYEFQFLRSIHTFNPDEVFAVKSRKILKCEMSKRFELRCSYLQTNMSLDTFTFKMMVEHQKLSGEDFDYSKRRYPWTELTDKEIKYCINDVIGLVEAMVKRMRIFDDNLYTLPLTSTGYVRREAKKLMFGWSKKHKNIFPDIRVFDLLEEAFRGGDTHANRYYANIKLKAQGKIIGIGSYDRSSSYPDVIENCLFPMTKFQFLGTISEKDMVRKNKLGKALLFRCRIYNLEQTDKFYGAPYISFSKCRNVSDDKILDNGRILEASYFETTLTDIDYNIIKSEYTYTKIEITECYESKYGELPEPLKQLARKYYTDKTELKGVKGKEIYYNMQKALLNAIYGMMVQSPVKPDLLFLEDSEDIFKPDENVSRETLLAEYTKRAFLPFQWGVWTTAWARYQLKEGINIVGDNYVYSDTDSVKYIKTENDDIDKKFKAYNNQRIKDSIRNKAFATDPAGKTHYMGVFEFEEMYTEFKTLGAKKYVYRTQDGKLHATIAGVNKKKAPAELEKHNGIDSFRIGFTFSDAGGTESVYNDSDYGAYETENKKIYIGKNVVIRPSTYTIGITEEYTRILSDARNLKEFKEILDKT